MVPISCVTSLGSTANPLGFSTSTSPLSDMVAGLFGVLCLKGGRFVVEGFLVMVVEDVLAVSLVAGAVRARRQ